MTKCIAPPRGDFIGEKWIIDLGEGKCRVVRWNGQDWRDQDDNPACYCDACSPMPIEKAQIDGMTIVEGSLMDMERRIKYDDKEGCWRVIFNGKVTTDKLKSSGEAHALLSEFIRKSKEPKY